MVYRWEGGNQVMEWEDLTLRDDLIVGDDLTVGWNATIAGTLEVTGKTTLASVDLGSAAVLAWVGTWAKWIKLKNLKNAATSELSGTALDVEIDIGWTPYHFHVYPTKA